MYGTLVAALNKVQGVSFASFDYRPKGKGGRAKVQLILGASTENLYRKDISILSRMVKILRAVGARPATIQAADELLASRQESLDKGIGNNSAYTQKDTYTYLNHLPGVKIHNETGELYVSGLRHRGEVIEAGEPQKPVKSSEKTLAKRAIEQRFLASQRFMTICLGNVDAARVRCEVVDNRPALSIPEAVTV